MPLALVSDDTSQKANYVFVSLAAVILIARMVAARYQPNPFDASFFVVALSLLVLIARVISNELTVSLGTASDAVTAIKDGHPFPPSRLAHVKTGTVLSLVTRLLETTFWWLQTSLLLMLYRRIVAHIEWTRPATRAAWAFLAASYGAVVITVFTECHPFDKYWQISPPPGKCVKAYRFTTIQSASLMTMDIALMVIASPVLIVKGRSNFQRFRIATLFALGLLCTTVSCLRLVYIFMLGSAQATRSFWAGLLVLVSSFVANIPIIYGSISLFSQGLSSNNNRTGYGLRSKLSVAMPARMSMGKFGVNNKVQVKVTQTFDVSTEMTQLTQPGYEVEEERVVNDDYELYR